MVKLVDAVDSKSTGRIARAGSIPAFGTIAFKEKIDKIAIRQYSMTSQEICASQLLYCHTSEGSSHKQIHRDIYKALLTQKENPNLWRNKCRSDI